MGFANHPLKELYELHALELFRQETSLLECPRCGKCMHVYVYRPKGWRCFFICKDCLVFMPNYVLKELIGKLRNAEIYQDNGPAIANALDRAVKAASDAGQPRRTEYRQLSGGMRHAEAQRAKHPKQ